jgi:hypothetical protein
MPDFPHDLPHLYLRGSGRAEQYTRKPFPVVHKLPQRDRAEHADALRVALESAFSAGEVRRQERDPNVAAGTPGLYLDFEIPPGAEDAVELLENRVKHIELVSVRQPSDTSPALAGLYWRAGKDTGK